MTGDAEGGVSWWEVVGLLSAFAYSLYTIALSHLSSDIRVAARTFISFVVIGVVSFGVSWVWEPTTQVVWSRSGIIGLTYLVLVGSLGRFLIQAWAQRSVSASFTALTFTAEPVFAIALSFLFLGERFTPVQTIGATMIVIALVLANLRSAITSEPCV
jgi:drug/metabolite transporter (DMT)-like permease